MILRISENHPHHHQSNINNNSTNDKNITLFQIEDFLFHFVNLELHLGYALACRTMTEKKFKIHTTPTSNISTGRKTRSTFLTL